MLEGRHEVGSPIDVQQQIIDIGVLDRVEEGLMSERLLCVAAVFPYGLSPAQANEGVVAVPDTLVDALKSVVECGTQSL